MNNEVLPQNTDELFQSLREQSWLSDFYLAGGTGLALQYGHRQSEDLDWFTEDKFQTDKLRQKLAELGEFELFNEAENTVEGVLDKVKVSFMTYSYPLLKDSKKWKGVKIADPLDISIMKLGAIAGRNTKKDFIDLYFFLNKQDYSLEQLLKEADKKFSPEKYDPYHVYKSLTYFKGADKEPMPKMLKKIEWSTVKQYFKEEVKKVVE